MRSFQLNQSGVKPAPFPKKCYVYLLLNSKQNDVYIGMTNNLSRRLAQHNGKYPGGAKATEIGRPWKMISVVYGFEQRHFTLKFESNWQYYHKKMFLIQNPIVRALESRSLLMVSELGFNRHLKIYDDLFGVNLEDFLNKFCKI